MKVIKARTGKILAVVAGSGLFAALLWAYSTGPDPRHTGAPGDDPLACTTAGCHTGTFVNKGGGSVAVNFPNGPTYTPGVQQTFTIVITDSRANAYGFQMTARLDSNLTNGQAGDFTPDNHQIVICDNSALKPCPANDPVQFIEHNSPYTTNTIQVQWTPPTTNVGNVHIYVAANAASGTLATQPLGDHIYTANYALTPACTNSTPTLAAGGIISAHDFNQNAGLASGTWLEIYGTNLSCLSGDWSSSFNGPNAPTTLNGVTVTIDGIKAYIDYVSSGQVNVEAPDDPNTGAGIPIVVANSAGSSNTVMMQKNAIAPALLSPASFNTQGHQWVAAQHHNGTYVGKSGLVSGSTFTPAKVGEIITIYGIGFGPPTQAGMMASGQTTLQATPNFRFGQTPATLQYAGLSPGSVGLYQFNVSVPNVSPGDMPLNVDVGGVTLNQSLYITVGP